MIEVDANVKYWSPSGMTGRQEPMTRPGYIEKSEVERLLEDAYRRGRESLQTENDSLRDRLDKPCPACGQ